MSLEKLLSQSLKRDLVLELALWMTNLNSSLKASFQWSSETGVASKITTFVWHQIVQHTIMITSLKILDTNCLLLLFNMSCGERDVFQWILTNLQHHLLKGHSKKMCIKFSFTFLVQRTQEWFCKSLFFFLSSSWVFNLSCRSNQKKTFSLAQDFHIHLKMGEASERYLVFSAG
jgi:hypothetical protein